MCVPHITSLRSHVSIVKPFTYFHPPYTMPEDARAPSASREWRRRRADRTEEVGRGWDPIGCVTTDVVACTAAPAHPFQRAWLPSLQLRNDAWRVLVSSAHSSSWSSTLLEECLDARAIRADSIRMEQGRGV